MTQSVLTLERDFFQFYQDIEEKEGILAVEGVGGMEEKKRK